MLLTLKFVQLSLIEIMLVSGRKGIRKNDAGSLPYVCFTQVHAGMHAVFDFRRS